jgi:hypothetical protein
MRRLDRAWQQGGDSCPCLVHLCCLLLSMELLLGLSMYSWLHKPCVFFTADVTDRFSTLLGWL